MSLIKEFAEAIVNDVVVDDGHTGAECNSCNSFGDYPDNIQHIENCIVLKAKSFLKEVNGE